MIDALDKGKPVADAAACAAEEGKEVPEYPGNVLCCLREVVPAVGTKAKYVNPQMTENGLGEEGSLELFRVGAPDGLHPMQENNRNKYHFSFRNSDRHSSVDSPIIQHQALERY